jgi:hypothetical protein
MLTSGYLLAFYANAGHYALDAPNCAKIPHHSYAHKLHAVQRSPFHRISTQNTPKSPKKWHFSYALVAIFRKNAKACVVTKMQRLRKSEKVDFFCKHYFSKSKNGHTFHVLFQKKR